MNYTSQRGVTAIVSIIMISAIGLSIGGVISYLGVNELLYGFGYDESGRALRFAETCAEEAHYRLKKDDTYTGGTVTLATASCTIGIAGGGSTRTITAAATYEEYTQTITSVINLEANLAGDSDGIDVTSWTEG